MLTRFEHDFGLGVMQKRGGGDGHRLHLGQGHDRLHPVAGMGNVVGRRDRPGLVQIAVIHRHHLRTMVGLEARNMYLLTKPGTHNRNPKGTVCHSNLVNPVHHPGQSKGRAR